MNNSVRITNLKTLIADKFKNTLDFAKQIGKNSSYFSLIFSGTRPFTEKLAREIEEKLSLPKYYLDTENTGNVRKSVAFVDYATFNENNDVGKLKFENKEYYPVPLDLLSTNSIDIEDAIVVSISGKTLEPLIPNGSKVLAVKNLKALIPDRIYVFKLGNNYYVRRLLQLTRTSTLRAITENPKYEHKNFDFDLMSEQSNFTLIAMFIAVIEKSL